MTKTPIVRPISWLNASINLLILAILATVGWLLVPGIGALVGATLYLGLSIALRQWIGRFHRRGISRCKRQEFAEAIPEFEASLAYFARHPWVDQYRAVTMLSAAAMSYREMALISLAFCYSQQGDGRQARNLYEQSLTEFPNNGIAQSALRLMNSAVAAQQPAPDQTRSE